MAITLISHDGFFFLPLLQADFLKGLPVYNKSNFSKFHSDSVCKTSVSELHNFVISALSMLRLSGAEKVCVPVAKTNQ